MPLFLKHERGEDLSRRRRKRFTRSPRTQHGLDALECIAVAPSGR
jgi:hypothetical protein